MSLYRLKSGFQDLLRPLVRRLAAAGVTANQVTLLACALSVILGAWLTWVAASQGDLRWFFLLPAWMFVRMAFNAVDGMLAREHGQQSTLGGFLNELTDVVSDAALVWPFAFVAPFSMVWVGAAIFAAVVSEYAGALGPMMGASRRYEGPMGKSDRAAVFGILGLIVGAGMALPGWIVLLLPILVVLIAATAVRRVRAALVEVAAQSPGKGVT